MKNGRDPISDGMLKNPTKGSSINRVAKIFGIFDPPLVVTFIRYKTYVIKLSFGYPPPPQLSTWFMNDPFACMVSCRFYVKTVCFFRSGSSLKISGTLGKDMS